MTKLITITFEECPDPPANGYHIQWRVVGSVDPYEDAGYFFSSPASFPVEVEDDTEFEGILQSDCGGGNLGNEVPWTTAT